MVYDVRLVHRWGIFVWSKIVRYPQCSMKARAMHRIVRFLAKDIEVGGIGRSISSSICFSIGNRNLWHWLPPHTGVHFISSKSI